MTNDPIIKIEQLESPSAPSTCQGHQLGGRPRRGRVHHRRPARQVHALAASICWRRPTPVTFGSTGRISWTSRSTSTPCGRRLAWCFRASNLFNNKSVLDNCTLPHAVRHSQGAGRERHPPPQGRRAGGFHPRRLRRLSGGQKQRCPSRGRFAWSPRSCSSTGRRAPSTPRSWARCSM